MINSVTINGVSVNFAYGLNVTDILNKDLNTGTLVIPQAEDITIEPFDEVVITHDTDKVVNLIVGSYTKKITRFGDRKHVYEVLLASPTLKLQRIVLPNRSITRKITSEDNLTISDVIDRYVEMYAPDLTVSAELTAKTDVPCPEFSWNRPTLFEVLNDLLKVVGCVITMPDFDTLSYLDVYEEGNAIDESFINNYEYSQDAIEYADAVEVEAQNVYSEKSKMRTAEWVNVRTTQGDKITTENFEIVLQKKIFTIEKVVAVFTQVDMTTVRGQTPVDITAYVVNKNVYDLLTPSGADGYVDNTISPFVRYRRNYLHFTEGDNAIKGLAFREDAWTPFSQKPAIIHALRSAMKFQYADDIEGAIEDAVETIDLSEFYNQVAFYVEYTTMDNITFRSRKERPKKHESVLVNNQESSHVYAEALGRQQQEFINRTGNRSLIITGRYENYEDIPENNDYIGDFVMTERQISIMPSYYLLKGTLSEFYSKDDIYSGINTKKRYTEIMNPQEAFLSNHITEHFLTLSLSNGTSTTFAEYLMSYFGKSDAWIQGAVIRFRLNIESTVLYSSNFLLQGTPYHFGNSVVYNVRMADNYNAGYQIKPEDVFLNFEAHYNRLTKYTDDFGNYYQISHIWLYRKDGIEQRGYEPNDLTVEYGRNFREIIKEASNSPIISLIRTYFLTDVDTETYLTQKTTHRVHLEANLTRYKDNREITSETLQWHIFPDSDIFITDLFFKTLPLMYHEDSDFSYKIAYSTSDVYNKGDKKGKGSWAPVGSSPSVQIERASNSLKIVDAGGSFWDTNKASMTSWAICDDDENIIIAVNSHGDETLYLKERT